LIVRCITKDPSGPKGDDGQSARDESLFALDFLSSISGSRILQWKFLAAKPNDSTEDMASNSFLNHTSHEIMTYPENFGIEYFIATNTWSLRLLFSTKDLPGGYDPWRSNQVGHIRAKPLAWPELLTTGLLHSHGTDSFGFHRHLCFKGFKLIVSPMVNYALPSLVDYHDSHNS